MEDTGFLIIKFFSFIYVPPSSPSVPSSHLPSTSPLPSIPPLSRLEDTLSQPFSTSLKP